MPVSCCLADAEFGRYDEIVEWFGGCVCVGVFLEEVKSSFFGFLWVRRANDWVYDDGTRSRNVVAPK